MPSTIQTKCVGSAALAAILFCSAETSARADVVISTDQTQNMTCAAGVCAPTAASAVLNVTDLENLLASSAVEVTTTGSGVQANNIDVTSAVSWSASNALALDAHRSIAFSATVASAGSGGISLMAHGGEGGIAFTGGNITFANTSNQLTIDGKSYTLVASIAQLASEIQSNPQGKFALANSYDASQDGTYTTNPIPTAFGGTFEGLGNAIQNFSMTDSTDQYMGLFSQVSRGGMIGGLVMPNASISAGYESQYVGAAGALVGLNEGNISHSSVTGSMTGLSSGNPYLGPLAGWNEGNVSGSSANVSVSNLEYDPAGGLVGLNGGVVSDSYATGNMEGQGGDDYLGGLVGENGGYVIRSYATGSVSTKGREAYYVNVGGLVGSNSGWIYRSHATGRVRSSAFASESVYVGGLAGLNTGLITESYETGAVTISVANDAYAAGGLVGESQSGVASPPKIENCYATGGVGGDIEYAGGLIGFIYSGVIISNSYATGKVRSEPGSFVGGFAGWDDTIHGVRDSYWDTTTSGKKAGTGNRGNEPGLKGLTTSKLQSGLPSGLSAKVWAEDANINNGLPYLIANPPE